MQSILQLQRSGVDALEAVIDALETVIVCMKRGGDTDGVLFLSDIFI